VQHLHRCPQTPRPQRRNTAHQDPLAQLKGATIINWCIHELQPIYHQHTFREYIAAETADQAIDQYTQTTDPGTDHAGFYLVVAEGNPAQAEMFVLDYHGNDVKKTFPPLP